MRWNILKETPPGSGEFIDAGLATFDDGFAEDGSDWGDDESNVIVDNLTALSTANGGISYAAQWNGDSSPRQGFMTSAVVFTNPKMIVAPLAKHKHSKKK